MSGIQLSLPAGAGDLTRSMFVRFRGPTSEQIAALGSSELHALVDWWSARGLAEWSAGDVATATLNSLYERLSLVQRTPLPLPWIMNMSAACGLRRDVPWWPQAGMESALRLADPPSRILSPQTPQDQRKELLTTLASIAASGGHHLVVVDRYLAANRGGGPASAKFLHSMCAVALKQLGSNGPRPASITVVSSADAKDDSDAAALHTTLNGLPGYQQILLNEFGSRFHDRFIVIFDEDRTARFKGNPTVACVLLGNGVDMLRGSTSIASIVRLPPSACGALATMLTRLMAR